MLSSKSGLLKDLIWSRLTNCNNNNNPVQNKLSYQAGRFEILSRNDTSYGIKNC